MVRPRPLLCTCAGEEPFPDVRCTWNAPGDPCDRRPALCTLYLAFVSARTVWGDTGSGDLAKVSDEEVARTLSDLLRVVKVAMPPELFRVDPRVIKARQLLAGLREVSGSRPPSVLKSTADDLLDLAFSDTPIDLLTSEPDAKWDITLGLDRFMVSGFAPTDRREAVEQILREWLTANGYLELGPEDPN